MTIDDVLNKMSKSGFTDAHLCSDAPASGHLTSGQIAVLPGIPAMTGKDLIRLLYTLARPERWNTFITCQSINLAALPLTERSTILVNRTVYTYRAFGDYRYRITAAFHGKDLRVEILRLPDT